MIATSVHESIQRMLSVLRLSSKWKKEFLCIESAHCEISMKVKDNIKDKFLDSGADQKKADDTPCGGHPGACSGLRSGAWLCKRNNGRLGAFN